MNFIYMGTAEIAVKPLRALIAAGHTALCVVTQPDKANARGNKTVYSAVKSAALEAGLAVYQPQNVSGEESYAYLKSLSADVIIVCAFGQLLKKNILELTKYGCLNLHASLLPAYRGASPINRVLQNGEKLTGVTVMYMNEGLDTGDMMIKKEVAITDEATCGSLTEELSEAAAALIPEALKLLEEGKAPREKQDETFTSYAEKITKEECFIDFNAPAQDVFNKIRAFDPLPGAVTVLNGKRVKLFGAAMPKEDMPVVAEPGTLVGINKKEGEAGLIIACSDKNIIIKTLKPEGKQLMRAADYYNGLRLTQPAVFGKNNG